MRKLVVLFVAICGMFLCSCTSDNISKTEIKQNNIAGNVVFKGSDLISVGAKITIQLNDVSLMDVSSITLGKQELTGITHFPIPFKITYNPKDIKKGMSYSVSARIEKDGKLLFINDTRIPVFNDHIKINPHKITLPVILVKTP